MPASRLHNGSFAKAMACSISPLLMIFAGLVSCTQPDRRGSQEGSGKEATFVVESLKGNAYEGALPESTAWWVSNSVRVGFRACMIEWAGRRPLPKQKFFVGIHGDTKGWDRETDDKGCLNWEEDIAYNHFAGRSGWVELVRDIVGKENQTGRRTVKVGVNPWAVGEKSRDSERSVVWERDGIDGVIPQPWFQGAAVDQALRGDEPKLQLGQARLIGLNAGVRVHPLPMKANGVDTLSYVLEMEPRIYYRKANNAPSSEKVQDGEFSVRLQVLSTAIGGLNRKALTLAGEPQEVAKVFDGHLRAEFMVRQEHEAVQGGLEVVVHVDPPEQYRGIVKPFDGVFKLGYGTMVEDNKGALDNVCLEEGSDACNFTKIVESASNYQDLVRDGYIRPFERYIFSNLKLRFLMVQAGETATRRSVAYTASTCITDRRTGRPLANMPMKITYVQPTEANRALFGYDPNAEPRGRTIEEKDESKRKAELEWRALKQSYSVEQAVVPQKTDPSGCLYWDGIVFHRYYEPEQYFQRIVKVEFDRKDDHKAADEKLPNLTTEFNFFVNPWDTNVNFGFDKREFTAKRIDNILHREKIKSRFFLGNYSYHTRQFRYNIDPFMDLEVKKSVLLELSPQVLRYSGIKDARKMTEHLRDGIYLMKIAIQKSYLDPRDNSGWLLKNEPMLQNPTVRFGRETLAARDFVTTNTLLVRVVDGIIIYPVELVMRDLRLMRVRSNFVIQLETVDERLIQAYSVLRKHATDRSDLEAQLKKFKAELEPILKLTQVHEKLGEEAALEPSLQIASIMRNRFAGRKFENLKEVEAAEADLQRKVDSVQNLIAHSLASLKAKLENGGENVGVLGQFLASSDPSEPVPKVLLTPENARLDSGEIIGKEFSLNEDMLFELKKQMDINDFNDAYLPKKEEMDLNLFVENDSGLEKRSFVGPVIYLSNAYGDSMRSTDNLDEVCGQDPRKKADVLTQTREELQIVSDMNLRELAIIKGDEAPDRKSPMFQSEKDLLGKRQNNAYQSSRYFGSLANLCYKNVDDLIEDEALQKKQLKNQMLAASLPHTFVNNFPFPIDYVSLGNDQLLKPKLTQECLGDLRKPGCMVPTSENTFGKDDLTKWLNAGLEEASSNVEPEKVKKSWESGEYGKLFFEYSNESKAGLCNLMANKLATDNFDEHDDQVLVRRSVLNGCLSENGLIHDVKYRVEETGNYVFKGGLNLNFNVGSSFSMGWSESWSAGFDPTDWLGPAIWVGSVALTMAINPALGLYVGAVRGAALATAIGAGAGNFAYKTLRPFSIKEGRSNSDSDGTSVSVSTYLVSQIAKFELDLLSYEKCAVVRLTDGGVDQAMSHIVRGDLNWDIPKWTGYKAKSMWNGAWDAYYRHKYGHYERPPDEHDRRVARLTEKLRRGLMVCEGQSEARKNPVKRVDEMYFYFTQHFTEGDMLDQADLYNHPWLLGLRGMRDFMTFVTKIKAQPVANLPELLTDLAYGQQGEAKKATWPFDQMTRVFASTLPTYPGYYTVLRDDERVMGFLLEQSAHQFSTTDIDRLGEINHPTLAPGNRGALSGLPAMGNLAPVPTAVMRKCVEWDKKTNTCSRELDR